jgi:crotonobetainyl-CoA:carnitine CoA-transferase CaiB-like acyl-CoA transferase
MGALDGLKVIDLTQRLPGPFCTMLLADMGADVIQVESAAGDAARTLAVGEAATGAAYELLGRNKRSVVLNLKSEDGREACLRLIAAADVVVEGFRPGVAARLGIDYEAALSRNPQIVYCSISGYGQDGPYRDRAGHDLNYLGIAGVLDMTRGGDGQPAIPGIQIADVGAGALSAAVAVLAATLHRRRTGQGQFVDVAMLDGLVSMLSIHAMTVLAGGPSPTGGRALLSGGHPCYAVYPTRDGHLTVGCTEPHFWKNFCEFLGRGDLTPEMWAESERSRAVKAQLAAILQARTSAQWLEDLEAVDTCIGPVNSVAQALADRQVTHRGLVRRAEADGEAGPAQLGPPFRMSATPLEIRRRASRLGEHTRSVLASAGYSDEQIESMREAGAIGGE